VLQAYLKSDRFISGDAVLFTHDHALTTKAQGVAYFAILPATTGHVIAFPPAAAQ
jgi:hypothetical protein